MEPRLGNVPSDFIHDTGVTVINALVPQRTMKKQTNKDLYSRYPKGPIGQLDKLNVILKPF